MKIKLTIQQVVVVLALAVLSPTSPLLFTAEGQGSLTPPGAPAPIMKTLDQVEARTVITNIPFTIIASGSYVLVGNFINTDPNTNGITIAASDVTIDLNGFTLTGAGVGSEKGIAQVSGDRATVYNGHVTLFTGGGLDLKDEARVRDITAQSNGGTGGVKVGDGGIVERVIARQNGGGGVMAGDGCIVTHCTAAEGTGASSTGFDIGQHGIVTDCTSIRNSGLGFKVSNFTLVDRCNSYRNDGTGFEAAKYCTMTECVAGENGEDDVGSTSHGFHLVFGFNQVARCKSFVNTGAGIISSNSFNQVADNFVHLNDDGGIVFAGFSPSLNTSIRNYSRSNVGGDFVPAGPNGGLAPTQSPGNATNPYANYQ